MAASTALATSPLGDCHVPRPTEGILRPSARVKEVAAILCRERAVLLRIRVGNSVEETEEMEELKEKSRERR